jgi:TusA-related sulfurtransferase
MSKTTLDLKGLNYTMPVVKLSRAMKAGQKGDVFEVISDYSAIELEIEKWCAITGNTLKDVASSEGVFTVTVVKG